MDRETMKATINVKSRPTMCSLCAKLLVRTYTENGEIGDVPFYTICKDCIKTFPAIIQNRLENARPIPDWI